MGDDVKPSTHAAHISVGPAYINEVVTDKEPLLCSIDLGEAVNGAALRLGILISISTSTRTHVLRTAERSVAVLRQIHSVQRSVTRPVVELLVVSLVLTQLDYGCLLS